MRFAALLTALTLATGAAAEPPAPLAPAVVPLAPAPLAAPEGRVPCRDTIHEVRAARGLPELDRQLATPDEPLLIAAVDHRIGGCAVMVMHGNTSDIRPLPAPKGDAQVQRIR